MSTAPSAPLTPPARTADGAPIRSPQTDPLLSFFFAPESRRASTIDLGESVDLYLSMTTRRR